MTVVPTPGAAVLEWRDLVWEAAEQGYVYPCCACCRDSEMAVCSDDHDWPCPACRQAPLPQVQR